MFDKVRNGDKIISSLTDKETQDFLDIKVQYDEFDYFRRKMIRAHNKFQAMQVMFWEDMMGKYERCESAAHRGKMLSTCKINDKFVIVERPQTIDEDPEAIG